VGRYFDDLPLAIPTKKLHLSAIRRFCDLLVQRHVMLLNPALSVRTERYSSLEGKTPEITREQARRLLDSIPLQSPADRRDKAVLATLIYTAARVGAVAKLRLRDFTDDGQQSVLKFREKGGIDRTIPVRHDLQQWLTEYRELLGSSEDRAAPLFRTLTRSGTLSDHPLSAIDISRLLKRRLQAAGLSTSPSPHSFRSLAATDLLLQGVPLEDVQYLLGHSDVRVTRLYDRRQRRVTRNIVEQIKV
jgi:site-specific recombinase XerD